MASSIVDLEDRYFRALHEVIVETERALQDVSRIDAHYVSQVVTVMYRPLQATWRALTPPFTSRIARTHEK